MSVHDWTRKRILKHLQKKKPESFTAADLAKDLNLIPRSVGGILEDMPQIIVIENDTPGKNCNRYRLAEGM